MTVVAYLIWGAVGGCAVEGMEFSRVIRATGRWPWELDGEPRAPLLLASILIRLLVGGGLAAGLGAGHQIAGVFGALTSGVAAPLILEQLAQRVPLTVSASDPVGLPNYSPEQSPLIIQSQPSPPPPPNLDKGEADAQR